MQQPIIDLKNSEFWDELCGSWLARLVGITDASPESLRRFDQAYFAMYPYLENYVIGETLQNKKVLEIGLGYGALGQLIAAQGCDYHGVDISAGPVAMMRHRLAQIGLDNLEKRVVVGSALALPHEAAQFDYVYTIGCLHHTGDLNRAVSEVYRVLAPGGKAIVMLYNRYSFRQLAKGSRIRLRALLSGSHLEAARQLRSLYDSAPTGEAAPHTDFVSRSAAQKLFKQFSVVKIDIHNFDNIAVKRWILIPRTRLLNNIARLLGLDLYITAVK